MMKRLIKAKQDNRGLTLLEIVVTIAIIGIVAVPLLNSFMVGMRTNNVARKAEDAAQTAQNLAEAFQTTDIDTIISSGKVGNYLNVTTTTGTTGTLTSIDSAGHYPVYNFDFGNKVTGDGNENYYLEATMTATDISSIPDIVDVGNVGVIKVDDKYYKYDAQYKADGYTQKTANLKIDGKCTNAAAGKYEYRVSLEVQYTKGTDVQTINILNTTKTLETAEGETQVNIYLLCNYYDVVPMSSDKININYKFTGTENEQNCNVFLIQQSITGASLNPDNVTITKDGGEKDKGLYIYSNVGTDAKPLKMTDTSEGVAKELANITAVSKDKYTIYQLDIQVHEGSASGKVVSKLSTTIAE
jgi:prepilin-type N-terminal cleavage/methylation domain-containing protein